MHILTPRRSTGERPRGPTARGEPELALPVLLRIAARNLAQHRTKTLIIGSLVAMGVTVLVVGNSLVDTAALGIRRAFIDNYTGEIMVSGVAEHDISLFGVQSPGGLEETPTLPDYETLRRRLESDPAVAAVTSQITGFARARLGDSEGQVFTLLFGIEPQTYRAMFPSIRFLEGRDLEPGEKGILISAERREELEGEIRQETKKLTGEEVSPRVAVGDRLRLTSFGNAGIRIRELPVVGIFRFSDVSEGVGADLISYVDAQSLRYLLGMTISSKGEIDVEEEETALLGAEDPDDLFDDAATIEEAGPGSPALSAVDVEDVLPEQARRLPPEELDTGAWHFLLVKLEHPARAKRVIAELERWIAEAGIAAQVGGWERAAGPFATTADVVRTVFTIAIAIIGVVAVIITMNTLVISVVERTSEIGTMRALGAQKSFVWKMFLWETLAICVSFGIAGALLALGVIAILNAAGIPATNVFLRVLFAGPVLRPATSPASMALSLLVVVAVGLLAHVYPVSVALRIQPVRAIQPD